MLELGRIRGDVFTLYLLILFIDSSKIKPLKTKASGQSSKEYEEKNWHHCRRNTLGWLHSGPCSRQQIGMYLAQARRNHRRVIV